MKNTKENIQNLKSSFDMDSLIRQEVVSHQEVLNQIIETMMENIKAVATIMIKTLSTNNKIIFFGNGGSAADAQHLAAELTGRFKIERPGLAGLALNTDTSALTAIANDYGYDQVFSRQVESLAHSQDLLMGITTSGNSPNVVEGLKQGRNLHCKTIALTGSNQGNVCEVSDLVLSVPSTDTARIQEIHTLIGHILCHLIDQAFLESNTSS